jgi:coenzyme F420-reducing hydrogenase gamma subunit
MSTFPKVKIAFFDFAGCEGCQLTVLDALQTDAELLDVVEIVRFREAMSEQGQAYEVAFVEGSCTRKADEQRLQAIRRQARIVIALGACAHLGGVNALANRRSPDEIRLRVYGQGGKQYENHPVLPVSAIIAVDGVIPGCPIDRAEFLRAVKALVMGQQPYLPDYAVCAECKRQEITCLFQSGIPCLGPVTRAGCGAICPAFGSGCAGCRGLVSEPNLAWLRAAAVAHGIDEADLLMMARLFLTDSLEEIEGGRHGQR